MLSKLLQDGFAGIPLETFLDELQRGAEVAGSQNVPHPRHRLLHEAGAFPLVSFIPGIHSSVQRSTWSWRSNAGVPATSVPG